MAADALARFPRRTGVATLTARRPLTPRMIRVTLQSEAFDATWPIEQPGEIITLLFLDPEEEVVLPLTGWRFPAGATEQEWRNYTVRRHDPATGEIDVDVVLHEPRGPACTWAQASPIGADVGFAGPRVDYAPRDGASWLLLCGDETALPAIAAILEEPPPAAERILAVIEVQDPDEEHALVTSPNADVRWVHRDGADAATTTHLADTLRELPLPAGPGQAWGAAESTVARTVREVLRDERGMERKLVSAKGYWLRSGEWPDDDED
jgi:NADPH-dependent ferric siderophore reductase